jgi:hypothetical protein
MSLDVRGTAMHLQLESGHAVDDVSEDDLLLFLEGEEFAVLSADATTYIQCAERKEPPYDYVLEYQDGSLNRHYQAIDRPIPLERALSAFIQYLNGDLSWQRDFRWQKMAL